MLRSITVASLALGLATTAACAEEEKKPAKEMEMTARQKATMPSKDKPPAAPVAPAPAPPSNQIETRELAKLGLSIDVPGNWTSKELNEKVATFRIPGGEQQAGALIPYMLNVRLMPKGPKNLAAAAKSCRAEVTDQKKEDSGNFYYVCKQTAMRRTVLDFRYHIPGKGKKDPMIVCSGSGAKVDALLEACRTLAKN